ncbi:hypothetical protein ACLMJK_007036 [Lecanora helva]
MWICLTTLTLLFDLLSVVSAASTSTSQQCKTKLGKNSVQPVPTSTVTTTKATKTYTTKSTVTPIQTVTPAPKTQNVKSTTTFTSTTTAPASAVVSTTTQTDTTTIGSIVTETYTNSVFTTETTTVTDTTTTIPTPAGFTPVLQGNGYVPKIKGREVAPRAAAPDPNLVTYAIDKAAKTQKVSPTQYPNAVTCTQTLSPYTTTTVTVTGKARTTKLPRSTITNTRSFSTTTTSTQYPPDVTSTTTVTITSTYDQSDQTTTITTDTTSTSTETALLPGPTYYAACASDNLVTNANGGYTISGVGISGSNYFVSAGTAYDCCANCQQSGCKSSFFFAAAYPDPVCFNSYSDTCSPGSVTDSFYTYSDQRPGYVISNGPCGQIQDQGNFPDYY